jgi:hypothetical protein
VSQQPIEHEEVLDPNFRFVIVSDNVPNHCMQAKNPPSKQTVTADIIPLLSTQGLAVMKYNSTYPNAGYPDRQFSAWPFG